MSKHPKLEELDYLFDEGVGFQLTSKEYEIKTGVPLPQGKKYLRCDSALAKRAKERGYIIADVQEDCIPVRTVIFERRESQK